MIPSAMRDGTAIAQQYLQQAHALKQELQAAMDAIAQNSLPDFEQSLWRQEMLATGMHRSLLLLRHHHVVPAQLAELRTANAALQLVSRTYGTLIHQAGQSASLFSGLCTLYGQNSIPAAGKQPNLYCEA